MMNDFLKIELSSKNEFRTVASFELNGLSFTNVDVKIDTGCPRTSFLEIHIGESSEGKTFLLASPLKYKSETYLAELEKLFILRSYNV